MKGRMLNTRHSRLRRSRCLLRALHRACARSAVAGGCALYGACAYAQAAGAGLPPLTVTDDSHQVLRRPARHGALGARRLIDTPFSAVGVDADELARRQAHKLGEVFFGDAAVTDNGDDYSAWAGYLSVRGMPLDWQHANRIDGNPFVGHGVSLPAGHVERIDLLKGASGFMYGFGAPGGIINRISKRPPETPVRSVELGLAHDGPWRQHIDLGRRLGPAGRFGYRLNASHQRGRTFNGGRVRRHAVSLALEARLTPALSAEFRGFWQDNLGRDQSPSIHTRHYRSTALPTPVSGGSGLLVGPGQHIGNRFLMLQGGLDYRFSAQWQGRLGISHSTSGVRRNEQILALQDQAGRYIDSRYDSRQLYRLVQLQAMLEGHARTAWGQHHLMLGATWQQQDNHTARDVINPAMGPGSLTVRNPYAFFSSADLAIYRATDIAQAALFASDTLALGERWSVLGGVRATQFRQRAFAPDGRQTDTYTARALSPTVALMFKRQPGTTWYASLVDALEKGATPAISHTNYGQQLPPLHSRQLEVGGKAERERWHATVALFRIARGAQYTDGAGALVQDGQSIYQGLELAGKIKLARQWQLAGGLMLLDARYGRGAGSSGRRVVGAPPLVATAQLGYRVPRWPGLHLGADAKFTGNTMLRSANDVHSPGHMLLDLGAAHAARLGRHDLLWRLRLVNALDRRYWQYQHENYLRPGEPRSLRLSVRVDF